MIASRMRITPGPAFSTSPKPSPSRRRTALSKSSTSRSSASFTIRCSASAGSTYQRTSLRRTRFTWNAAQPFAPGLRSSGFVLRNYLTLIAYADVIQKNLK